jgi:hypothetical protein
MLFLITAILSLTNPMPAQAATAPCVGLALPSVRGADGDATATATSLRELLTSYLAGPKLRVIPLDSRLVVQAIDEAREKNCGHVLAVTVTRTRGGNGVSRALGRAARGAAWAVPYGGAATSAVRGAALGGANAVSELANSTKAKDGLAFEFSIVTAGAGANASPRRESLRAKTDGEDLATPLAERVAESVVSALAK